MVTGLGGRGWGCGLGQGLGLGLGQELGMGAGIGLGMIWKILKMNESITKNKFPLSTAYYSTNLQQKQKANKKPEMRKKTPKAGTRTTKEMYEKTNTQKDKRMNS